MAVLPHSSHLYRVKVFVFVFVFVFVCVGLDTMRVARGGAKYTEYFLWVRLGGSLSWSLVDLAPPWRIPESPPPILG